MAALIVGIVSVLCLGGTVYGLDGLLCNGVETNMSDIITAVPAGVCMAMSDIQFMLQCQGDVMYYHQYDSSDCSGSPLASLPATTVYNSSSDIYDDVNIVCNGIPCDYIKISEYGASHCKINEDNSINDTTIYVENYCTEVSTISGKTYCNGSSAVINSYFTGNCTSDPSQVIYPIGTQQCAHDKLYDVVCATAMSGYSGTTTPSPTSVTTSTTAASATPNRTSVTTQTSTSAPEYSSQFSIEYELKNLLAQDIDALNANTIQNRIVPLIEESYIEEASVVGQELRYNNFKIVADENSNTQQENEQYTLTLSTSVFYTAENVRNLITSLSYRSGFVNATQYQIRLYLSNDEVEFESNVIPSETVASKGPDTGVLVALIIVVAVVVLICVVVFVWVVSRKTKKVDSMAYREINITDDKL